MAGTRSRMTEFERLQSQELLKPIRIAFGDIFLSSWDGITRYVILDVGKAKLFSAASIQELNGEQWIMPVGGVLLTEGI